MFLHFPSLCECVANVVHNFQPLIQSQQLIIATAWQQRSKQHNLSIPITRLLHNMIIPNNAFDFSSMVVQSNTSYLQSADDGAQPATSAISTDGGAVEPNLTLKNFFSQQETMMQQINISLESSGGFGWGDFPLLQQSMVAVVPSEAVSHCARPTANEPEASVFGQDWSEFSSSSSFETISPVSSTPSLCSTEESTTSQEEDSSRSERRVQFAKVQVREYALTLGDHPWCENGFPLSLDWKFAQQQDVNIDDYEHERLSGAESDRSARKLDVWERRNLLRRVSGFSTSELNGMERMRMLQQQREFMVSSTESEDSELESSTTCSAASRMLRHSNTLQNLSSACV